MHDQAIYFACFPRNLDYFEALIRERSELKSEFEMAEESLRQNMPSDRQVGVFHIMGGIYRRFFDIKNQVYTICETCLSGNERCAFDNCARLLLIFEKSCRDIMESRIELIGLFNALSKAQYSKDSAELDKSKAFKPLDVIMDRQATIEDTVKQMQLNARVRYNQAVKKVKYDLKKPGKRGKFKVTDEQVSISLFSRHVAFLEIVFAKRNPIKFWKKIDGPWDYQMQRPLVQLDQISIHSVPESPVSQNFIEFRFHMETKQPPVYFECADAKQKKDLLQQFRLLAMEACPSEIQQVNWQHHSNSHLTPSASELEEKERQARCASIYTHGKISRPTGLIKLTEISKTEELRTVSAIDDIAIDQMGISKTEAIVA